MGPIRRLFSRAYHAVVDTIFGYDFFISYSWRDPDRLGRNYALALKDKLTDAGFVCFLDSTDYEKGDDWQEIGRLALARTRKLLLVATPAIFDSEPVMREVRLFRQTGRQILPVDIGATLSSADADEVFGDLIPRTRLHIREPDPLPTSGPSSQVVDGIHNSFRLARQKTIRRRIVGLIMVLLALLALQAEVQRRKATWNAEVAQSNQEEAERNARQAEENAGEARRNESRAREALVRAGRNLARAHEEKSLASLERAVSAPDHRDYQRAWLHALEAQRQPTQGEIGLRPAAIDRLIRDPIGRAFARRWASRVSEAGGAPVRALAVDDARLIAGFGDGIVRFWDYESATLGPLFRNSEKPLSALAFSADASLAALGTDDGQLLLLDLGSFEPLWRREAHPGRISGLAFSADGNLLASNGEDKKIGLWRVGSGEPMVGVVKKRPKESFALALSPDAKLLAFGDADDLVVYDLAQRRERLRERLDDGYLRSLAFSPDGSLLASGSGSGPEGWGWKSRVQGALRLWDVVSGTESWQVLNDAGGVGALAFNQAGKLLSEGRPDGNVGLYAVDGGDELLRLSGHGNGVSALAFDEGGTLLISGTQDGGMSVWDIATRAERTERRLPNSEEFSYTSEVGFGSDGSIYRLEQGQGSVRRFDVEAGRERWRLTGLSNHISDHAYAEGTGFLAVLSGDRFIPSTRLELWRIADGEMRLLDEHGGDVSAIAVDVAGRLIAGARSDGSLSLWDTASGKELKRLPGGGKRVHSIAFSRDGGRLATGSEDGSAHLWDLTSDRMSRVIPSAGAPVQAIGFVGNGSLVAISSGNPRWDDPAGRVQLLEFSTGAERWARDISMDFIMDFSESPDGKLLAAHTAHTDLYLWNVADGAERLRMPSTELQTNALALDPKGRLLVSAGVDGSLRVVDLAAYLLLDNAPAPSSRATLISEALQRLWGLRLEGLDVEPYTWAKHQAREGVYPEHDVVVDVRSAEQTADPGSEPVLQTFDIRPLLAPPSQGRDKIDQLLDWLAAETPRIASRKEAE